MGILTVRYALAGYLVLFLGLTTWPGATFLNDVQPLILGLPFNLFSIAVLIMGGLVLLSALYLVEEKTEDD